VADFLQGTQAYSNVRHLSITSVVAYETRRAKHAPMHNYLLKCTDISLQVSLTSETSPLCLYW